MSDLENRIKKLCHRWNYQVKFHDGLCDLTDTEGLEAWKTWLDIPLEAAERYLKHPLYKEMFYKVVHSGRRGVKGQDFKNFRMIGYINAPRGLVVVSVTRTPSPWPYCVSYGGSGRYFRTMEDAWNYVDARFGRRRTPKQEQEILRRHSEYRNGVPLDLSDFL